MYTMIWRNSVRIFRHFTFTDDETIAAMKTIYAANGYIRTAWCCGISWTEKMN
jgi:hypothetical protein